MSFMFATTITGNGDVVVAVEVVDEDEEDDEADDDAEDALVVDEAEVVEDEDDDDALALLLWAPCTVDVEVTVLVTVFVEPVAGGGAGGAVEGAKRLLATEAMPAVTKTAPSVMATMRKWRRGAFFSVPPEPLPWELPPFSELSSFDAIDFSPNLW